MSCVVDTQYIVCGELKNVTRKIKEGIKVNGMNKHQFTISQEDWSLHRKGHEDQQRHRQSARVCRRRSAQLVHGRTRDADEYGSRGRRHDRHHRA